MAAEPESLDDIKQFESMCCVYDKQFDTTRSSSIESGIQK